MMNNGWAYHGKAVILNSIRIHSALDSHTLCLPSKTPVLGSPSASLVIPYSPKLHKPRAQLKESSQRTAAETGLEPRGHAVLESGLTHVKTPGNTCPGIKTIFEKKNTGIRNSRNKCKTATDHPSKAQDQVLIGSSRSAVICFLGDPLKRIIHNF